MITIEHAEWHILAALTRQLHPPEPVRGTAHVGGAVLRHVDTQRRWTVHTSCVQVDVRGGFTAVAPPTSPADQRIDHQLSRPNPMPDNSAPAVSFLSGESFWLPGWLVERGAELAASEGTCDIVVDDDTVTVSNRCGSAQVLRTTHLSPTLRRPLRGARVAAGADITLTQLRHLVVTALDLSATADSSPTAADVWLAIEPARVSATVVWAHLGAPSAVVRTPAWTTGEINVRVPYRDLSLLVDAFGDDEDLRIEVDGTHHVLWIEGAKWSAAVALLHGPSKSLDIDADVESSLVELPLRTVGDGQWTVRIGEVEVTVSDAPDRGAITATVLLADHVPPTIDALAEINELNAGLSGIRVWLEDGVVLAGVDLQRGHIADLPRTLRALVADTNGLGPFITMLGSTIDHRDE